MDNLQIQIASVKLGVDGALSVEVRVPAKHLDAIGKMEPWVIDENGERSESSGVSRSGPKPSVQWLFAVAKPSKSFVLHFSSGEAVDLSPLIR